MAKYKKKLEDDIRCPLEYGLAIFGGKWCSDSDLQCWDVILTFNKFGWK